MNISVVIPLYNEAESLPELHDWIARVMNEHNFSYEIIFVDDGSNDGSAEAPFSIERGASESGVKIRFARDRT